MIKTTHKIVIVKNQKDIKKGYLKLRTIQNRKAKDKSIGHQILLKNWNSDKQRVSKKEPFSDAINKVIQKVLNDAKSGSPSSLTSNGDKSFLNFSQKVIDAIPSHSTRQNKQDALIKFKKYLNFLGVEDIKFDDIDVFFIRNYYTYLLDNIAIVSANTYMSCLKFWVNQAIDGRKHHYEQHPFNDLKKKKDTKKYKVVNDVEINKFLSWTPDTPLRNDVYNGFLFMMHSAGLRISDALLLRFENIEQSNNTFYLNYRNKKSGTPMKTKLTLSALIHLFHFTSRYDVTFVEHLKTYEVKSNELDKKRKEHQEELSRTRLKSFYRLKEEYDDVEVRELEGYTWDDLIAREEIKESRIGYLEFQIRYSKEEEEDYKNELVSNLGSILMKLKYDHPKDTIMPYMNKCYKGEPILSESQEKNLSKYKVHFNDHLRMISKKIGVKTRFTPHMARHIFAQRMFLANVNMHYISMMLGHSTLKVTENYREQLVTRKSLNVIDKFAVTLEDIGV